MKKNVFILIVIVSMLQLFSCKKECLSPTLYFSFSGFDSSERSQIIIKRYQKKSGFKVIIDSQYNSYGSNISIDYDYLVEIPLANQKDTITNITLKKNVGAMESHSVVECLNGIQYTLNGKTTDIIVKANIPFSITKR